MTTQPIAVPIATLVHAHAAAGATPNEAPAVTATGPASAALPTYDRAGVRTGIVHFGLGNFHRAHQAMFLDRLLTLGEGNEWGICGVGVMPGDARMRDVLAAQDSLYTLVLKSGTGELDARVIGSIHDYRFAPDDREAVLSELTAETTRIVSLTVTEGGYRLPEEGTENPLGVFDLIVTGLARRRAAGTVPFTVMSCDNLPGNGEVARRVIIEAARRHDAELAEWIAENVAFPSSMVDRITPVTTDADRALVRDSFGIEDAWPVVAEPFVQWVLEDHFTAGRPALEKVGVQLVSDVAPYEKMKLRLLNASHQGMAYFGLLSGHTFAHEATTDPRIVAFLHGFLAESRPTLDPVPGIDLDDYVNTLFERFTNPAIADTLNRLATDAGSRIPTFVLPTIEDNLAAGRDVTFGAALVASWVFQLERDGHAQPAQTEIEHDLTALAARLEAEPLAIIGYAPVFGDLASQEAFVAPYLDTLAALRRDGVGAVLDALAGTRA
ncbi:mannitol dehydrogenase family protein [Mycetocola tolaasinivorans]|uniref:Mannitol-1-phosphate 5-dehydrogenase n=1 Tax=Mycetocola tolaasinivorans TaxID=76635 RepID=A0A3L7A648_9MICO|nr:mannitol dehydrogenase family protein [Mycetocola tolaasinivorans]RLP75584.1 mannitol dehydrogenase family protein [Mycetocola tolaasinivorans]